MFGRMHFHVVRDIERLECSAEFRALNFEEAWVKEKPKVNWVAALVALIPVKSKKP
jgi:phage regulator Rha-like protein